MEDNKKFFDQMKEDIINGNIPDSEKERLMKNFLNLKEQKINLLITGATGSGKSSTINALFNAEVATVGIGVGPETIDIKKFELDNLVLWDSPGLGDGKEEDKKHARNIVRKLQEKDSEGNYLIDVVLVILDGSSRDLGTSYTLINDIIIPNLGDKKEDRILVAINQADMAMKGRYWNSELNKPEPELEQFLDEKVASVHNRIFESTGVEVRPIYYAAGYKEDGVEQSKPYNLSKLLYYIIECTPKQKRLSYIDNINKREDTWEYNDNHENYNEKIKTSFIDTIIECAKIGSDIGERIGSILGDTGEKIGRAVGNTIGGLVGAVKEIRLKDIWDILF